MTLHSWFPIDSDSPFTIYTLPFGIFSTSTRSPRVGVAIGNKILDVFALSETGFFDGFNFPHEIFLSNTLNRLIQLGNTFSTRIRSQIQSFLINASQPQRDHTGIFVSQDIATLHLPIQIPNYTDFYSSLEHATNVGTLFRGKENALHPNWKHMPIAYHGRASSIILSNTPIVRPKGQQLCNNVPTYAPTTALDFELELGFVVGKENPLGSPISIDDAHEYIFGLVLVNDWSARDIQRWEYVPLGPFLGKNFSTAISPWVIPLVALEPFRVNTPKQSPLPLPYLQSEHQSNFDIELKVSLQTKSGKNKTICKTNSKYLYWDYRQLVAHHTSNGCNLQVGDLLATGTISGTKIGSFGSLLELTQNATKPIDIGSEKRGFLEDFDSINITGKASKEEISIGFGSLSNQVLPSR